MRLRSLTEEDPHALSAAFAAIEWSKPVQTFEAYLREQERGERWVRVAEIDGEVVGYVTVVWSAPDPVFRKEQIPEIMDLNVLPPYRNQGVGSILMAAAESEVSKRTSRVGLRVGLHAGYGAAQRLYVKRGYVPDGSGAVREGRTVEEGAEVPLDDELTLRMRLTLDQS